LPQETVDALLADPTGDLTQILLYHVLGDKVMSTEISDGMSAPTLQGDDLTFGVSDAGVTVNGAAILAVDVAASNGVIHVIDTVLMPADLSGAAPAEAASAEDAAEAPAEAAPQADVEAPAEVPATGASAAAPWLFITPALFVLLLAIAAFFTRSRTA
jgi:hypothetical protein